MQFRSHQQKGIPVLSFFTGAGFLDMGFIQAGFNVVYHNEFHPEFARGFQHGMSAWFRANGFDPIDINEPEVASIEDLDPVDVIRKAFGEEGRPALFGMIGGPPCPDFSVGGKNRGGEGENGKLSKTYVDLICAIQPTFFLFENVRGLLRTAKHRKFFHGLQQQLHSAGYLTDVKILNALEYGVPQDRERVFFVGFQEGWLKESGKMPEQTLEDGLQQVLGQYHWFPYPEPVHPNAKTAYQWGGQTPFGGDGGPRPEGTPAELIVLTHLHTIEKAATVPNGKDYFKPYSKRFGTVPEGDDSKKSFKRLHRYRYSPTAAYGNNEVHLHPFEPRRISVREAMRIQSVPETYELPADMSLSDKFKTVGNGVPVKLARAMAGQFMKLLTENPAAD